MVPWAQFVAARNDGQAAILFGGLVQIDHHRQQVEVGVRKEGIVLVPLEARLAVAGWLEIQLGVVQLNVRPDQVLDDVEDLRIEDEVVEGLVMGDGVEHTANGPRAVVRLRDGELVRCRRQSFGLDEHFGQGGAQGCQLCWTEELRKHEVAVVLVEALLFGLAEVGGGWPRCLRGYTLYGYAGGREGISTTTSYSHRNSRRRTGSRSSTSKRLP